MTIPNSPEQKLIETMEQHANKFCDTALILPNQCDDGLREEAITIIRSLLSELAELREKAKLYDSLKAEYPGLFVEIEQKERT